MLPDVSHVILDWTMQVPLTPIRKTVDDFDVKQEQAASKTIFAILQPETPQKLLLKPEGQRRWNWWQIWTETRLQLDWILQDACGRKYRVMESIDWDQAGYYSYELAETPGL